MLFALLKSAAQIKHTHMNNKLSQEQVDSRVRMYDKAIELMTNCVRYSVGHGEEQAAAVLKELRGNRDRFVKRMEAGKVGRKSTLNR